MALDKSLVYLRPLVNASYDALIVMNEQGIVVDWNQQAEKTFGWKSSEAIGHSLSELIVPPEYRRAHHEGLKKFLETGVGKVINQRIEVPALHKQGKIIPVELTVVPIKSADKYIFGAFLHDVTQRKHAESLQRLQLKITELLLNSGKNSQVLTQILELICIELCWDVGFFWMVDSHAKRLICMNTWSEKPGDDAVFMVESHKIRFSKGFGLPGKVWNTQSDVISDSLQSDMVDARYQCANRSGIVCGFAFPICFENEFLGVLEFYSRKSTTVDEFQKKLVFEICQRIGLFLQRRRSDEKLKQSQTIQASLKFLSDVSAALNASLDIQSSLNAVTHLIDSHFSAESKVFFIEDKKSREVTQKKRIVETIENLDADVMIQLEMHLKPVHFPQSQFAVSKLFVPIHLSEKLVGVLALAGSRIFTKANITLCEDIAGRIALAINNANLYADLKIANRAKDEFLATLSHELRTPLNAILGWSELLEVSTDPEVLKEGLSVLKRNAQSQAELIDDILDVSRIITGKISLEVEQVLLVELINKAIESIQLVAQTRNIDVVFCPPPSQIYFEGDKKRLLQVLWNILSNALKFTESNGKIDVCLRTENKKIIIEVKDTGKGIEKKFLSHVFDKFWQQESSKSRRFGGLGLGLSIVHDLVQLHGGIVEVESEGSQRGSLFRIVLPLAGDVVATNPKNQRVQEKKEIQVEDDAVVFEAGRLMGTQILVVDDAPDVQLIVKMLLQKWGASVTTKSSAAEGLEALKSNKYDALISDIGMPIEDGLSFIRKIRSSKNMDFSKIPAVALSAYVRQDEKDEALAAGFLAHISKPVTANVLLNAVLDLLHK